MQDKLQSYADGKYDVTQDIENTYLEQRGTAAEELEELTITKRVVSTGESAFSLCAALRLNRSLRCFLHSHPRRPQPS